MVEWAEHRVVVDKRRVRYLVAGIGPPVVLLHGLGTNADEWRWLLPRLAASYRVYAPDLQHQPLEAAPTTLPAPGFALPQVVALLDALELDDVVLVGSSLGGLSAVALALASPDRVRALALLDSAGLGREVNLGLRALSAPGAGEAAISFGRTPLGSFQRAWGRAALLFANPLRVPPDWIGDQYRLAQQPGFLASTLAALREQVAPSGQRVVLREQLGKLSIPTLVVWGELDQVLPVSHAHAACRELRQQHSALLAYCGHLPHVEQPERCAQALNDFLASLAVKVAC